MFYLMCQMHLPWSDFSLKLNVCLEEMSIQEVFWQSRCCGGLDLKGKKTTFTIIDLMLIIPQLD